MFDAIVVGAGHAGVEAALVLAKRQKETALITINLNHIAKMPCNPSIGGPAKGIVVRDLDALGGIMPHVADSTALQFKMLNTAKGPGVRSLRVQSDKLAYSAKMKEICLNTNHLTVIEDIVEEVIVENNKVKGIKLKERGNLYAEVLILTTGTYMDSTVMISDWTKKEGPDGDATTQKLSASLRSLGFNLFRLKTGTPQRILTSSIDFSKTKYEPGTKGNLYFSEESKNLRPFDQQLPCYLTYTNAKTHTIIRANLNRSSMYSGVVKGIGPRYCPSIEDKVVRFADKERHQLFLEPESLNLDTTYIQGFSTSMPKDVQEEMVHSLPGLEKAIIKKYAYAIEYDAIDPLQVKASLETKIIDNLFIAGQILGTSGYEEAAGLGFIAGLNASLKLEHKEPLILRRDESYIGVMIDDLVTKGTKEPYRLLTSRAEFRLLLRHDNAEDRLIEYGYKYGLISLNRYNAYLNRKALIKDVLLKLKDMRLINNDKLSSYLKDKGYASDKGAYNAYELVKRPNVSLADIFEIEDIKLDDKVIEECDIAIKYEGYIIKAKKAAERMIKLEKKQLPTNIDYQKVDNLRLEAREKLNKVKPLTLAQASRISGINPTDIQVLAMHLRKNHLKEEQDEL